MEVKLPSVEHDLLRVKENLPSVEVDFQRVEVTHLAQAWHSGEH